MKKELICLDFDNTIILSDKAHISAYNKAFAKFGLPAISAEKMRKEFGRVGKILVKRMYPNLSHAKLSAIIKEHHRLLVRETAKFARPVPGAIAALKKLRKRYKLAITTNCSKKILFALMKGAGIDRRLFSLCIGHDMVVHPKPAPDEIYKAEHLLHLNAKYMVGDTVYDIMAGKKSKTKVIAVLTGHHSRAKLQKKKPFKIIKSIKELPEII